MGLATIKWGTVPQSKDFCGQGGGNGDRLNSSFTGERLARESVVTKLVFMNNEILMLSFLRPFQSWLPVTASDSHRKGGSIKLF
jgi:hypothetical protein